MVTFLRPGPPELRFHTPAPDCLQQWPIACRVPPNTRGAEEALQPDRKWGGGRMLFPETSPETSPGLCEPRETLTVSRALSGAWGNVGSQASALRSDPGPRSLFGRGGSRLTPSAGLPSVPPGCLSEAPLRLPSPV